ncbi:MAG: hypothetical protein GTN56_09220 [Xanthomonadales bacterium]|nr:hypothetical protein [Xanthomonadales bacterium]NIP12355.1 hypothetical protein [Xanthomonadales bacterium]
MSSIAAGKDSHGQENHWRGAAKARHPGRPPGHDTINVGILGLVVAFMYR